MALMPGRSSVGLRDLLQVCNLLMVKHSQRMKFSLFFFFLKHFRGSIAGFAIFHGLYKSWKTVREKEAIRDSN